jgi:hypothetical protein
MELPPEPPNAEIAEIHQIMTELKEISIKMERAVARLSRLPVMKGWHSCQGELRMIDLKIALAPRGRIIPLQKDEAA